MGGREIHTAILSSIQDLGRVFSTYHEEVLVRDMHDRYLICCFVLFFEFVTKLLSHKTLSRKKMEKISGENAFFF